MSPSGLATWGFSISSDTLGPDWKDVDHATKYIKMVLIVAHSRVSANCR